MLSSLLIFALVFTVSAFTPGPDTMTIFSRALSGGRFAAVPYTFGVVLAKLTLLTLVVLGLAAVAKTFGTFFVVLKFAGAAYLVWAGLKMWRSSGTTQSRDLGATVSWNDAFTGYALGISNPNAIVFYVAVLPTVLDVHSLNLAMYLALCATLTILMVVIAAVYAFSADRLRNFMKSSQSRRITNQVAGGAMIGSAVLVATR
jgi:threonine/homoserine/homoserine lactone efflux protein